MTPFETQVLSNSQNGRDIEITGNRCGVQVRGYSFDGGDEVLDIYLTSGRAGPSGKTYLGSVTVDKKGKLSFGKEGE